MAIASHLVEHIPPFAPDPRLAGLIRLLADKGMVSHEDITEYCGEVGGTPTFVRFMDEAWRVLKPGGEFAIAAPHGNSQGFLQDPTHINGLNEATWSYFTPGHPLYDIYRPKPWIIKHLSWSPNANIEVVLVKITKEEVGNDPS